LFRTELVSVPWIKLFNERRNSITTQVAVSVVMYPHDFGGFFDKMFVGK
jgi:hypothetical protein